MDKDGNAFPVEGNHRYLVRIVKAPGQTDITFDIEVSEWDAVDTVQVKPDQTAVPVITNIETNGEYNKDKKIIDLYYTQDGTISFDAACSFAPDVRVKYDELQYGNWITIEKSEPELITKATNIYKRHFKITFPKMVDKGMRHATLLVHNGGSEVECDTIFVRHTITYPGTDLEGIPVEKDGVTTIWAPVNCGATRLPTEIYLADGTLTPEQLQSNQEQIGNLYQWGRKVSFKPLDNMESSDFVKYTDVSQFPTYEEGTVPGYADDKFIISDLPVNFLSWFSSYRMDAPNFSPTIKNAGYTWPSQNDPCPKGWRIANQEEWTVIVNEMKSDKINADKRIWIASSIPGFVVPLSGSLSPETGLYEYGTLSFYHTSSYDVTSTNITGVRFDAKGDPCQMSIKSLWLSSGLPLRCVAE